MRKAYDTRRDAEIGQSGSAVRLRVLPGPAGVGSIPRRMRIARIELDASPSNNDYPRGYEVYVSDDPENWGAPVAIGESEKSPITNIRTAPKAGRMIRNVGATACNGYGARASRRVHESHESKTFHVDHLQSRSRIGDISMKAR